MGILYHPAIILLIGVLGIGGWYQWKRGRHPRARARLRAEILQLIDRQLDCLLERKEIGSGNVGVVLAATLAPRWEEQLGIRWKSPGEFPERVAVKLCFFSIAEKRVHALAELSQKLEGLMHSDNPPAICPFLALGKISAPAARREFVVEIMPLVEGEELRDVLRREKLPPQTAIAELVSILQSALLFEELDYLVRGLDIENVMVQPNGKWLRIDFDDAKPTAKFPLSRLVRPARLSRTVLESTADGLPAAELGQLLKRLRATEKHLGKKRGQAAVPAAQQPLVISSLTELIELVENLAG